MATVALSTPQISQLSAIVTGGGFKRSATREAAIKRFQTVCGACERPIDAETILAIEDFEEAATALRKELQVEAEAVTVASNSKRSAALSVIEEAAPQVAPVKKEKAAKPAKAKDAQPEYRDNEKVDALMVDLLKAVGAGKVGAFRAEWIKRDPKGYGKLASTQQKGIMRTSLNRLVKTGKATRDGSIFSAKK